MVKILKVNKGEKKPWTPRPSINGGADNDQPPVSPASPSSRRVSVSKTSPPDSPKSPVSSSKRSSRRSQSPVSRRTSKSPVSSRRSSKTNGSSSSSSRSKSRSKSPASKRPPSPVGRRSERSKSPASRRPSSSKADDGGSSSRRASKSPVSKRSSATSSPKGRSKSPVSKKSTITSSPVSKKSTVTSSPKSKRPSIPKSPVSAKRSSVTKASPKRSSVKASPGGWVNVTSPGKGVMTSPKLNILNDSNHSNARRGSKFLPQAPMLDDSSDEDDDDDSDDEIKVTVRRPRRNSKPLPPRQMDRGSSHDVTATPRTRPKKGVYNAIYKLNAVQDTDNEPLPEITLLLRQPNLKPLKLTGVDPANTTIRMVREFLHEHYYKGHHVPMNEQRQLLVNQSPIFDKTGNREVDDQMTLADHHLTYDPSQIELEFMHVHVIDPSTNQSMTIDNVDPMNDVLLEMRKLALKDGYNIERLRVLHKEADYAEIGLDKNQVTFFDCGVKHEHTLILEWPKITIYIKLPRQSIPEDYVSDDDDDRLTTYKNDPSGRPFQIHKQDIQAELCKVENIQAFVTNHTGIPPEQQGLFFKTQFNQKSYTTKLEDPTKVLADYGMEKYDEICVTPMALDINFVDADEQIKGSTTFPDMYPNDTIDYVKEQIASGRGKKDRVPAIPKKNQCLTRDLDDRVLKRNAQRLFQAKIKDGEVLNVTKANITVHVKLPKSKLVPGNGGKMIEASVNPKVDDIETLKDEVSDETGVNVDLLPPLRYKGEELDDDDDIGDHNIADNDILEMDPIQVNIHVQGTVKTFAIKGVDPFNDTIADIKQYIQDDLKLMPISKQRLSLNNKILGETKKESKKKKSKKKKSKKHRDTPPPSIFDCGIKHKDTLELEKSTIDVCIEQPNGKRLMLENLDPQLDTPILFERFLSDKYYRGKDQDGTIPEEDLLPLKLNGKTVNTKSNKTLRDLAMFEDGCIIKMQPMTVHANIERDDGSKAKRMTFDNVDPMNDSVKSIKVHALTGLNYPASDADKWTVLHREADLMKLDLDVEKQCFYYNGIKDGDNLIIQRKSTEVSIILPKGSKVKQSKSSAVRVRPEKDDGTPPSLVIKVNPEKDDLDSLREHIWNCTGVPPSSQKINKVLGKKNKERLDAPGSTKLAHPKLDVGDDEVLELEPPTVHFEYPDGGFSVPLQVMPSDTVEDVKRKLEKKFAKKDLDVPYDKQRLRTEDGKEIGGSKKSLGNDDSVLMDLGVVKDGDTVIVEKSKIALTVNMPHGMDPVEVVVDPRRHGVDEIRRQIYKKTRFPKVYQQRFYFDNTLMDEGFVDEDGEDLQGTLEKFDIREFSTVTLDPTRVYVKRIPENEEYEIEDVNPLADTIYDLKKRIAEPTNIAVHKQRLLNSVSSAEFHGNANSKETLQYCGIKDGEMIHVELKKIVFRIVLPALQELTLEVDPRKDDLQMIRDYIFEKYYDKRKLPKKAMRSMLLQGGTTVLDDEPGDKKLIEFGLCKDRDHVKLKPCPIVLDTPKKDIFLTNTDPFHDDLHLITKFVKSEGVDIDGCHIEYKGKMLTDYNAVLYDLDIGDEDKLHFVR